MKVKTIRDHSNDYPPVYFKTHGRIYSVPPGEETSLVANGYVEIIDDESEADGVSGGGGGA